MGVSRCRRSLRCLACLAILAACLPMPTAARALPPRQDAPAIPPELVAGPFDRVDTTLLAGEEVQTTASATGNHLTLERFRLQPGERKEMIGIGPSLHYIETGALVLEHAGTETPYAPGQQAMVDGPDSAYAMRNDSTSCLSVLRFWYVQTAGATTSTDESGPDLGETDACAEPYQLLFTTWIATERPLDVEAIMPTSPGYAFIAKKTWDGTELGEFDAPSTGLHTYTGPVALVVEQGTLNVENRTDLRAALAPEGFVAFSPGRVHAEINAGPEPVTALMVGVIAAAAAPPTALSSDADGLSTDGFRYASPWNSFSLSWDRAWSVLSYSPVDDAADPEFPFDQVQLGNGVSVVELTARPSQDSTVQACVTDFFPSVPRGPQPDDLEPAVDAQGQPMGGGDAGSAFGVFTGTRQNLGEIVWYFECRALPATGAMLTIEWAVRGADFNDQIAAVDTLLAGIATS